MEVRDLNGDHLPDIMTGQALTGGATTMTVMLGTGTYGGFLQESNVNVGGAPRAITTGDINNDGFIDIIYTQLGSIEFYLGDGTGSLSPPIYYYPTPGQNIHFDKTIAADLNGDGNLDLLVDGSQLYVRFGHGDGTFDLTQTLPFGGSSVYVGDFNNDGKPDILASAGIDYPAHMYLGQSNGTFGTAIVQPNMPGRDLQFVDLNNDGFKDIIATSSSVYVFYNDQTGGFGSAITTPLDIPAGTNVSSSGMADFDGDGILDAVVVTGSGLLRIFKGYSLTSFQETQSTVVLDSPNDLHLADLNNDGMPDITFVGYSGNSAYTLINKCGDNRPTFSISGYFSNNEGYAINGAGVSLESVESGVLSSSGGTSQGFTFNDLPAHGNYRITPTHPLFTFIPLSVQINDLTSDRNIEFVGSIKHFRVYGQVRDYCCLDRLLWAEDVPMRLVGPFSGLTGLPDMSAPQMDVLVRTDAGGNYMFKDVLPISAAQFYQIQFPADPVWHGITPVYAIRGLSSDQFRNFYASRNVYTFGVHATTPNGQPRAGLYFYWSQPGYSSRYFITDADGRGSLDNLRAGLRHELLTGTPTYRFSPDPPTAPFLTENTEIETRLSLRNRTDFDNDGKTDLAVFRPSTGSWFVQRSSDNGVDSMGFGLSTDIPVPADYDGDQKADLAVFRPSDGNWYIILSSTGQFVVTHFGSVGDVPLPADFDRDGKADLNVFRPSTGTWYTLQSYWQTTLAVQFGKDGDRPVTGDFDGDTYNDRAVYRPETGVWYMLDSSAGFRYFQFGLPEDVPVPADYDGDTTTDLCVWRPSTGVWYARQSTDGAIKIVQFGLTGDQPLSGDFDGDGINDLAVYRPGNNTWYGLNSSDGDFWSAPFGANGDIPVPFTLIR